MKIIKTEKVFVKGADASFLSKEIHYNAQGKPVEIKEFDAENYLVNHITITYNSSGLPITESYLYQKNTQEIFHYQYDENGDMTQMIQEYMDSSKSVTTYNRTGKVEEATTVDDEGELESRTVTTYNENGQPLQILMFDEENDLEEKQEFVYNEAGLVVQEKQSDNVGVLQTTTYTFNEKNRLIAQKLIDGDEELSDIDWKFEYEELNENTLIQQVYSKGTTEFEFNSFTEEASFHKQEDFKLISKVTTTSDEDGRPLEVITEEDSGIVQSVYEYTFWED
ncbi:MAG: hypothetical protein ACPGJS_02890 [Flammeovirgaceae bacterium]